AGTGKAGSDDSPANDSKTADGTRSVPATFFEPAGLSEAGGKLYVADTNNHSIRTIDLKTGTVATLAIAGLKPPEPPAPVAKRPQGGDKLPLTTVRSENGKAKLRVELDLPAGYHINPLAPLEYLVEVAGADGPVARDGVGKPVQLEKPATQF